MSTVRSNPCTACPYRRDVPSGLWEEHEYDKLVEYDAETPSQPFMSFACHATPDHLCNGWAVVGTHKTPPGHDLISLRIEGVSPDQVPQETVPLFDSHTEAAEHGKRDIENPSEETKAKADQLMSKYPRLRSG